jgi:hypothetical protein
MKVDGSPVSLETLSTLNSFKYLNNVEKVNENKNIMDTVQEQEQINEALFHHFKLR